MKMFNSKIIQKDFPILQNMLNGKRLVYLDNASTTQKPQVVIDAISGYYSTLNSNIHRGVHTLSERATDAYENTRTKVAQFIHAEESSEIIFTRGATEAINLVASSWGETNVNEGDVIIVTALEHHSNLVPWQQLVKRKKAELRIIPITDDGFLDLNNLDTLLSGSVKLLAITQMSNVLGVQTPIKLLVQKAQEIGAKVLVDAAQGMAHLGLNVKELNIDFAAFSSHKMFGPTGVGVLWARKDILEAMPPYQFGGDMVKEVFPFEATWNDVPWKFEAGTPNISGVVAFGAAIEYLESFSFADIQEHDQKLYAYARTQLREFPKLKLLGPEDPAKAGGAVSFVVDGVHPHDIGSILNDSGVAVRTGHHCAQPLMQRLQVQATVRASFSIYNDEDDVDALIGALKNVYEIFKI
ncbi:cysteine desulfurase [Candidatus Peregrinibacteria bacterium]|nr:cysteine desulfurase [Candidatus Peregrinibacteria bacterium]